MNLDVNFEQMIAQMTPDVHASLRQAVELGKWPNGQRLTQEQRETCMRAVIAYDMAKLPEEQRTGYIDRKKQNGHQHGEDPLAEQTINIIN